jgi:hypothetical protein
MKKGDTKREEKKREEEKRGEGRSRGEEREEKRGEERKRGEEKLIFYFHSKVAVHGMAKRSLSLLFSALAPSTPKGDEVNVDDSTGWLVQIR